MTGLSQTYSCKDFGQIFNAEQSYYKKLKKSQINRELDKNYREHYQETQPYDNTLTV